MSEQLRAKVLERLADAYERQGGCHVNLRQLAQEIGVPFQSLEPTLGVLYELGLLELTIDNGHGALKPEGFRVARENDVAVPRRGNTSVTFNAPISGSAVAFDRGKAQVTNNVRVDLALQMLEQAIQNASDIPPDKKKSWLSSLGEMAKHPAVLEVLKAVLPGG